MTRLLIQGIQHQSRPQKLTPGLLCGCLGSGRVLFFFNFASALICLGSNMSLLRVSSLGPLYALKCEANPRLFILPPVSPPLVFSKYICTDIWSFFSRDYSEIGVCLLCPLWVSLGLLGVSYGSTIADPKQTLCKHRKLNWDLVAVCFL